MKDTSRAQQCELPTRAHVHAHDWIQFFIWKLELCDSYTRCRKIFSAVHDLDELIFMEKHTKSLKTLKTYHFFINSYFHNLVKTLIRLTTTYSIQSSHFSYRKLGSTSPTCPHFPKFKQQDQHVQNSYWYNICSQQILVPAWSTESPLSPDAHRAQNTCSRCPFNNSSLLDDKVGNLKSSSRPAAWVRTLHKGARSFSRGTMSTTNQHRVHTTSNTYQNKNEGNADDMIFTVFAQIHEFMDSYLRKSKLSNLLPKRITSKTQTPDSYQVGNSQKSDTSTKKERKKEEKMEGLIPYVYRAIMDYKNTKQGAWMNNNDSPLGSYMRLPGDSGRFENSDIKLFGSPDSGFSITSSPAGRCYWISTRAVNR
ncbi:hypothetical protein RND71_021504 [Anisodus tanguticus]|uniref:Uncharacterized protein n=1 Tax=Anisodus tanguticus TaxID=243964 RepID=A0AAE1VG67_9SOLA|nr:hypothetical protein RND71_021504 [Anisodus tanguticus]